MNAGQWNDARSLLAVRLDSLGDVLMTTPALRALKQCHAARRVTLLTSSSGAAVARLVPEIDEVITYDPPWMKHTPPRPDAAPDFTLVEALRRRHFDAAVVCTVYTQNPLPAALLCYLAEIPLRLAHCRENPYQLLTHWVPESEPEAGIRHEVRRQLDLVASVGARTHDDRLSLSVPSDAASKVETLLASHGIGPGRPWAVVHPGASAESRRYPAELFAGVVSGLVLNGIRVVLTGSALERDLCLEVAQRAAVPVLSLAGRTDLAGFVALLARAPLLISSNTGPVHIAAAVGTPVVDIYALTNPQHTPWRVPHRLLTYDVPCRDCLRSVCPEGHHDCLRRIPPEAVVAAAVDLLAETAQAVAAPSL
ncbi:MAG: lipopolysaccharide heptosyltransferase II [Dehalococcoidia bacterium]|nr:lipopolysaccharide heptosyltransferase II [Dehalococcoidia bacterium]